MAVLKSKQAGHAAGIYADMTLDGPEIGTLVAIVDRAKNLPNRKTMGKQDPYCAMRLAKEARKTQTDRRGGQTPRWDEELRFTVHDSPDYYKLKCSIFNDDKRTDLIGEAWVDLTDVIKPGGGQSDHWQQLNFKGKYAGDVRIELTYYDTREQAPEKKRREPPTARPDLSLQVGPEDHDQTTSAARQLGPREIKRRPLPQSPSEHMSVSQQPAVADREPFLPQLPSQFPYESEPLAIHTPVPVRPQPTQPSPYDPRQEEDQWLKDGHHPLSYQPQPIPQETLQPSKRQQPWQYPLGQSFRDYPESPETYPYTHTSDNGRSRLSQPPLSSPASLPQPHSSSYYNDPAAPNLHRPVAMHLHSDPTTPYHSSPVNRPSPISTHSDGQLNHTSQHMDRLNASPTTSPAYQDSPLRQSMSHPDTLPNQPLPSNAPPPRPPKHRDTPPRRQRTDYPPSAYGPQTFRSTPQNSSISDRSPLQSIEDLDRYANQGHRDSTPAQRVEPTEDEPYHQFDPPFDQQPHGYAQHYPQQVQPRPRPQSYSQAPRPYSQSPQFAPSPQAYVRRNSYEIRHPDFTSHIVDEPQRMPDERDYRQSRQLPITPSRLRDPSPDLQPGIARKAVGDQPKRLSNAPFGPDSYDVLNPSSSPATNAKSIPETQEQAKESARMRGVEKLRDLAPIIGNDGRVIDPSDHLPADTWAPEPERKTKKPEHVITIRAKNERQAPAGARSSPLTHRSSGMASATLQTQSPITISSPVSPLASSPAAPVGRNRLQKPPHARPSSTQAQSSSAPQPPPQQAPQTHPQPQPYSQPVPPSQIAIDPLPESYARHQNSYHPQSSSNDRKRGIPRPPLSEYQVPVGTDQFRGPTSAYRPYSTHNFSNFTSQNSPVQNEKPSYQRNSYSGGMHAYANENHASTYERSNNGGTRRSVDFMEDPLAAEMSLIDLGPSRNPGRPTARSSNGYRY